MDKEIEAQVREDVQTAWTALNSAYRLLDKQDIDSDALAYHLRAEVRDLKNAISDLLDDEGREGVSN